MKNNRTSSKRILFVFGLCSGGILITMLAFAANVPDNPEAPALGILFLVNSSGDQPEATPDNQCETAIGNGVCTLRAAIQLINSRNNGGDGIFINIPSSDPGCSGGVCTINLGSALPNLSVPVSVNGPGADKLIVQRSTSGVPNFRIFNVTSTGTVSISGMTITNGHVTDGDGGGVQKITSPDQSIGTLNLTNCRVTGNQAFNGGGINNRDGTMNVTGCLVDGNECQNFNTNVTRFGQGGGIYNFDTMTITNTAVDRNTANGGNGTGLGGGVFNEGSLHVVSSTISRNTATSNFGANGGAGGGIYNDITLQVTNSTIALNFSVNGSGGTAGAGGILSHGDALITNSTIASNLPSGVVKGADPVQVKSTIIAKNSSSNLDVSGSFTSAGFNLIGAADGSTGFTAATDHTGTAASPLDPKFDPGPAGAVLEDNGGPTETMALICGSPAIDRGSSSGLTGNLTTDQRGTGFARTVDDSGIPNASDGTDIGAFEYGAGPITPSNAVSRKFHGSSSPAPLFDVPLPLSCASMGIECRRNTGSDSSGPNAGHDHELIVTFGSNVTVDTVDAVNDSTDLLVGSASFSVSNNVVTVDLHNIPNAVRLNINLRGVSDGTHSGLVTIPMGVLLGDVNGSGVVTTGDANLCKGQALVTLTNSNFRDDVNVSGTITSGDVNIIKQNALAHLP
jgi:hypothetical protein